MFDKCQITKGPSASLVCAILLLMVPGRAGAIERHTVVALPNDGFGSSVRRLDPGADADHAEVVGAIFGPDGSSVAALWTRDVVAGWTVTKLPTPEGFDSSANDVSVAPTKPAEFVVGVIGILVGNIWTDTRPAIWTREDGGDWNLNPSWEDKFGHINASTEELFGNYLVVGAAPTPGGNRHAIIATELDAGFQMTDLGTLGGANSEAEDVVVVGEQNVLVVGRAQLPDGKWRATLWRQRADGAWQAHDLGAIRNGQSQATITRPHNDGLFAVGSSFDNAGHSRGVIFWMEFGWDVRVLPFAPLPGVQNSIATDALWFSGIPDGTSNTARFRAVGSIYEEQKDSDVVSAAIFNESFGVVPAASVIEDITWDLVTLNGIASDGSMTGDGLLGGSGDDLLHALVLTPTDTHMPDAMSVHRGSAVKSSSLQDAWWNDGQYLGILPQRSRAGRTVDTVFDYQMPFLPPVSKSVEIHLTASLVAKASSNIVGNLRILLYDHTLQEWETVSTGTIGSGLATTSVALPWAQGDFNADGRVRVRVVVTSNFMRGRWGYAIDEIIVTTMP